MGLSIDKGMATISIEPSYVKFGSWPETCHEGYSTSYHLCCVKSVFNALTLALALALALNLKLNLDPVRDIQNTSSALLDCYHESHDPIRQHIS